MTSLTKNRRTTRMAVGSLLAVGLVAGGAFSAQAAGTPEKRAESTNAAMGYSFEEIPAPQEAGPEAPELISEIQYDILLGDKVRPSGLVVTPDGKRAYVTAGNTPLVYVVDLAGRKVITSITLPNIPGGEISMNAAGTRAVLPLAGTPTATTTSMAVLDLTNNTIMATYDNALGKINNVVMNNDGSSYYVVALSGGVSRVETATGKVLASIQLPRNNGSSSILSPDQTRLIIGRNGDYPREGSYSVLNAATLDTIVDTPRPETWNYGGFAFGKNDSKLYMADTGEGVAIIDPATGSIVQRVNAGSRTTDVIPDDSIQRAYTLSQISGRITAADFNTGERSSSMRNTTPGASALVENPATKEIISANRGFTNGDGSTITVFTRPSVSDPADVTVTALGEEITFSSAVTGVTRGNGGGVIWQSSPDGETWTDIDGALGNDLTVTVTAENFNNSYRLRFADEFWGTGGASAPAKALADGPVITLEGDLPGGTVGSAYTPTIVTATGQPDLTWSVGSDQARAVAALPEGLELNPTTGEITGTPTTAGEYIVPITVTDGFGTATRSFPLTVAAAVDPTVPTVPETPAPGVTTPVTPTEDGNLARTGAELTWPALAGALALLLAGAYALRRGRTA